MKKWIWMLLLALALTATVSHALANELKLPEGLKTIEAEAFEGDTALDQVALPNGLEAIGDRSFADSSVNSIRIPASVLSIGTGAFDGCAGLTTVYFDGTQENWDSLSAGSGISGLEHVTVYCLGGADVTDSGTCGDNLSWSLDANGLLTISGTGPMTDYSYSNPSPWDETQISSVLILPGVTSVGDYAFFSNAGSISSVVFPESIKRIGNESFYHCDQLIDFSLPNNLEIIGYGAFGYCNKLMEISIPASVKQIGASAFASCQSLTRFTVAQDNPYYSTIDGVLLSGDGTKIIAYPAGKTAKQYTIPEGVTGIGTGAFIGAAFTTVIIPEAVASIESEAFSNCYSLQIIDIPESISYLPWRVFAYCRNLKYIGIPASVTEIEYGAFTNCDGLTDVYYNGSEEAWGLIELYENNEPLTSAAFHWNSELQMDDYLLDFYTFEDIDDNTCRISRYTGDADVLEIPGKDKMGKTVTAIGTGAFASKTISSVTIPDTVNTIGQSAFAYCKNLTEIEFPASVASLGTYAFEHCTSLERVILSDAITTIPSSVFRDCASLTDIHFPANLTSIGGYAFYGCESLVSVLLPEGLVSIGNYTFCNCTSLSSLSLPEGFTSIGYYAFNNCAHLSSVVLPSSLNSIGSNAFSNCSSISSILLPSELKTINSGVFANCVGLQTIMIPAKVSSIIVSAFEGCANLSAFQVDENNTAYYETDGMLVSRSTSYFILCPLGKTGECTVPEGVTGIGAKAFQNCAGITGILLPESLQKIGNYAFENCSSLESIRIPQAVSSIGTSPFSGCSSIKTTYCAKGSYAKTWFFDHGYYGQLIEYICYTPANVEDFTFESIDENSCKITGYTGQGGDIELPSQNAEGLTVTVIGEKVFFNNSQITSVKIPEGITEIESNAFSQCSKLMELVLPQGLRSIGKFAFSSCYNLGSLTIPDTVSEISDYAFDYCHALKKVTIPGTVKQVRGFSYCRGLEEVYILPGAESIESSCFNTCENLSKVELPDTVTVIDDTAFNNCSALESIRIPSSLQKIGYSAFGGCISLKAFSLPQTVTEIGNSAFYGCSGLLSMDVPAVGVLDDSFSNCTSLTSLTLAEGITAIELENCSALTSLFIPDSVTSLELVKLTALTELRMPAFLTKLKLCACPGLTEVTMPEGLTKIETNGFYGNTNITSIQLPNTITEIGDGAFSKSGLTSIVIPNSVTTIGSSAFSNCASLSSIVIPNTVTTIADNTFYGCVGLNSVTLPDSLTAIGYSAFYGCTGLTSITIPDSVRTIGSSAFYDCTSLASVVLSKNVSDISSVFQNSGITSILIPASVRYMSNAFNGCYALEEVTFEERTGSVNGYSIFEGCTNLKHIYAGDQTWRRANFSYPIFDQCSSLYAFEFPEDSYTYSSLSNRFGECEKLACIKLPGNVSSIPDGFFSDCPNLTTVYCKPGSYGWSWAEENGYTPVDAAEWPYDSRAYGTGGSTIPDFDGSFTESEITMRVGQYIQLLGEVTSSRADIGRITITIDNFNIEDDENDRYATKEFAGVQSVSLGDYAEFTLDGTREPLNAPGTYTAKLWAKAVGNEDEAALLDEMTVIVSSDAGLLTGSFAEEEMLLYPGITRQISGTVVSTGADISLIALTIDGYHIPDDESDRYTYEDFSGHQLKKVDLGDWGAFILDTTRAPFNEPGAYNLRLWAKTEDMDGGIELAQLTVLVGWKGYVQAASISTYESATAEKPMPYAYVDNTDPIYVLEEQNDRYRIIMFTTQGKTDVRWVDASMISANGAWVNDKAFTQIYVGDGSKGQLRNQTVMLYATASVLYDKVTVESNGTQIAEIIGPVSIIPGIRNQYKYEKNLCVDIALSEVQLQLYGFRNGECVGSGMFAFYFADELPQTLYLDFRSKSGAVGISEAPVADSIQHEPVGEQNLEAIGVYPSVDNPQYYFVSYAEQESLAMMYGFVAVGDTIPSDHRWSEPYLNVDERLCHRCLDCEIEEYTGGTISYTDDDTEYTQEYNALGQKVYEREKIDEETGKTVDEKWYDPAYSKYNPVTQSNYSFDQSGEYTFKSIQQNNLSITVHGVVIPKCYYIVNWSARNGYSCSFRTETDLRNKWLLEFNDSDRLLQTNYHKGVLSELETAIKSEEWFSETVYDSLVTDEAKKEMLKNAAERIAEIFKTEIKGVFVNTDGSRMFSDLHTIGNSANAEYSNKKIYVMASNDISLQAVINSIAHELRHSVQYDIKNATNEELKQVYNLDMNNKEDRDFVESIRENHEVYWKPTYDELSFSCKQQLKSFSQELMVQWGIPEGCRAKMEESMRLLLPTLFYCLQPRELDSFTMGYLVDYMFE